MSYQQITPLKDIRGSNFPNATIRIPFELTNRTWVPRDSYLRFRIKFTKANGEFLACSDDIAPNMGTIANLFQNIKLEMAGKCVEEISDYIPQIDALHTRLNNSKTWLDGVGKSTNWWQYNQRERMREVSDDGVGIFYPACTVGDNRVEMGFDANNNTVAIDDVGLLTFAVGAGGAALPLVNPYQVGDIFRIFGVDYLVLDVLNNITMEVSKGNPFPANTSDWFRVPAAQVPSSLRSNVEFIWKPPLGIWDSPMMPPGMYSLIFVPANEANYQNMSVESVRENKLQNIDFKMEIEDIYLYLYTMRDNPFANKTSSTIPFTTIKAQVEDLDSLGLQQKQFALVRPISAMTVCFQDKTVISDTRFSASKFKVRNSLELSLERLFLQYRGVKLPSPDSDPDYTKPNDYLTQRYFETLMYSGQMEDGESKTDWLQRGPYYHFALDDNDPELNNDKKAVISFQFSSDLSTSGQIIFFYHNDKQLLLTLKNGRVLEPHLI